MDVSECSIWNKREYVTLVFAFFKVLSDVIILTFGFILEAVLNYA